MASDYWAIRAAIIKASQDKNDEVLKALAKLHPDIFKNVVSFAKKQMSKQK